MPFIRIQETNSYYHSGRLSIGLIVVGNGQCVLIDSGLEEKSAKQVNKELTGLKLQPLAIINTHFHADHCGGNSFFQRTYRDIQIYASEIESGFINHPQLEPSSFCCTAQPHVELENKFLQATASQVTTTLESKDQTIKIGEANIRIISLPGHTPGMIGVISPDNIFYCGDAIFGEETFQKHGLLFYTNLGDTLVSFGKILDLESTLNGTVYYHGGFSDNIKKSVEQHRADLLEKNEQIRLIVNDPAHLRMGLDDLTALVMARFQIPNNVMQIALTKACVQAHIAYLEREQKVAIVADNGKIVYRPKTDSPGNTTQTKKAPSAM